MFLRAKKIKDATLVEKIIFVLTIAAAVLLLGAACAKYVDPASFWPIAFAGLFYPVIFFSNLLFFIYWLIKKRITLFIPLLCLLIGSCDLTNYYGLRSIFSKTNAVVPTTRLRIMTWNAHYFHSPKKYATSYHKEMIAIMHHLQPDIISIQEYDNRSRTDKKNLNDSIAKALGKAYYFFKPLKHSFDGMAIFSKYPIKKTGFIQITKEWNGNQCIYVDVRKGNKIIRVYNVHLRSSFLPHKNRMNKRNFSGFRGVLKKTEVVLRRLKKAFVYRSDQVKLLSLSTQKCPYPYIMTGDFNDTPASYTFKQMSNGLTNTFNEKGSGIGKTYCGSYPGVQIDYVLVKPEFTVLSYNTVKQAYSDHYPVYADVEWK